MHPVSAYLWRIILQNTSRQLCAHTYCSFTCLHAIDFKQMNRLKKGNTYVRYEFVSVLVLWRPAFMIALVFCVFYTMIVVGIYHNFLATTVNSAFFVPLPLKFYSAIIKCITQT